MLEQAQEEEALVQVLGQFQEKEFLAKIRHTNTNQMKMNIKELVINVNSIMWTLDRDKQKAKVDGS